MPSTQAGLSYLLNRALASGITYYAMLTSTLLGINSTMQSAAAGEVSGGGYVRLPCTFGAASIDNNGFPIIISTLIQFSASGAPIGPFQCLAITDSPAGSGGTVLAYVNYAAPITIQSGATSTVQFPIELKIDIV